jgi:hypothetical protein
MVHTGSLSTEKKTQREENGGEKGRHMRKKKS